MKTRRAEGAFRGERRRGDERMGNPAPFRLADHRCHIQC